MCFNLFIGFTALTQGNLIALITSGGFGIVLLLFGIVSFLQKLLILSVSSYQYLKLLSAFDNKAEFDKITEDKVKKALKRFLKHQKEHGSK